MDPNTLPNQPVTETPQPTSIATPVQQPVMQSQQPFVSSQLVVKSNPVLALIKKDKGILLAIIIVLILIVGGASAYYLAANDKKSVGNVTLAQSLIAKSATAQSNAQSVVSVAEIYAVESDYYPASAAAFMSNNQTTKVPIGITVLSDANTSPINADNGLDHVAWACLKTCVNTTGGRITYWDYKTDSIAKNVYYVGDANASSTFVYPSPSNNDSQRKNDLARLVTALASYTSNNRGALPSGTGTSTASWTGFVKTYLKYGGNTFVDPSGIDYIISETATLPAKFDSSNPVIVTTVGAICNGSSLITGQSARKVAFQMRLEVGSVECVNN